MKSFFTRDNITLVIALAGFLISIFNLIYMQYHNRFKIKLNLFGCSVDNTSPERSFLFKMSIENKSRQPIGISRIILHVLEKDFDFDFLPHAAYTWKSKTATSLGSRIDDEIKVRTISLPQTIGALGIIGNFFYVITDKSTPKDLKKIPNAKIEVVTNRGKKTFLLSDFNITYSCK